MVLFWRARPAFTVRDECPELHDDRAVDTAGNKRHPNKLTLGQGFQGGSSIQSSSTAEKRFSASRTSEREFVIHTFGETLVRQGGK